MTRFRAIVVLLAMAACSYSLQSTATRIYMHNHCSSSVCGRYWGGRNNVVGGCSQLAPGGTWTITASPNWQGASLWAIVGGGCQDCKGSPEPEGAFTRFQIDVDGRIEGADSYDIPTQAGRFNVAMKVVPSSPGCPSVVCTGRNNYGDSYADDKVCPTGADYDLYLCHYPY